MGEVFPPHFEKDQFTPYEKFYGNKFTLAKNWKVAEQMSESFPIQQNWYLGHPDSPKGPYPESSIINAIKQGKLNPKVLAKPDNSNSWKPIQEWSQFSPYPNAENRTTDTSTQKLKERKVEKKNLSEDVQSEYVQSDYIRKEHTTMNFDQKQFEKTSKSIVKFCCLPFAIGFCLLVIFLAATIILNGKRIQNENAYYLKLFDLVDRYADEWWAFSKDLESANRDKNKMAVMVADQEKKFEKMKSELQKINALTPSGLFTGVNKKDWKFIEKQGHLWMLCKYEPIEGELFEDRDEFTNMMIHYKAGMFK